MSWLLPAIAGACVLLAILLGAFWNIGKAFWRSITDAVYRSL